MPNTDGIDRAAILRRGATIDSLMDSGVVEPTERQMATITVQPAELRQDLRARLDHLAGSYRELFNPPGSNGGLLDGLTADSIVEGWLEDLLLANDGTAALCAGSIMRTLIAPAEARTSTLWRSTLGRVLASRGAYPEASMPRAHVQELLGVTKQRISQMVREGLLDTLGPGNLGSITTASVARLLVVADR